jgi:hypothetical protein
VKVFEKCAYMLWKEHPIVTGNLRVFDSYKQKTNYRRAVVVGQSQMGATQGRYWGTGRRGINLTQLCTQKQTCAL